MTIKQVLIATLIGAGAVVSLVHRLPKEPAADLRIPTRRIAHARRTTKSDVRLSRQLRRKDAAESRLSLSKTFD